MNHCARGGCSHGSGRGRTSPHQPARSRTVLRAEPTDGVAFFTCFTAFLAAVLACASDGANVQWQTRPPLSGQQGRAMLHHAQIWSFKGHMGGVHWLVHEYTTG